MRTVFVALLGSALAVGSAQAQSLAAAAEKEKERRAKQQASGEGGASYDDATLASAGGKLANDPSIPPAATPASGKAGASRGGMTLGTAASSGSSSSKASTPSGSNTVPGSSVGGTGEQYWRSRAQQLRAAVTTAEAEVKKLEGEAGLAGPINPGPRAAPCQQGVETKTGEAAIALRDRSRRTVACDQDAMNQDRARESKGQLDAARQTLAQAQKVLASLEDEARRAGAQPGWIR